MLPIVPFIFTISKITSNKKENKELTMDYEMLFCDTFIYGIFLLLY